MLANSLYNNTPLGQKEQRSKSYRPWRTASDSQAGYSSERKCFKTEYREEYVPGTEDSPGYVKSWKDTVEVTCEDSNVGWHRPHRPTRKPDGGDSRRFKQSKKEGRVLTRESPGQG